MDEVAITSNHEWADLDFMVGETVIIAGEYYQILSVRTEKSVTILGLEPMSGVGEA